MHLELAIELVAAALRSVTVRDLERRESQTLYPGFSLLYPLLSGGGASSVSSAKVGSACLRYLLRRAPNPPLTTCLGTLIMRIPGILWIRMFLTQVGIL